MPSSTPNKAFQLYRGVARMVWAPFKQIVSCVFAAVQNFSVVPRLRLCIYQIPIISFQEFFLNIFKRENDRKQKKSLTTFFSSIFCSFNQKIFFLHPTRFSFFSSAIIFLFLLFSEMFTTIN